MFGIVKIAGGGGVGCVGGICGGSGGGGFGVGVVLVEESDD